MQQHPIEKNQLNGLKPKLYVAFFAGALLGKLIFGSDIASAITAGLFGISLLGRKFFIIHKTIPQDWQRWTTKETPLEP